MKHNPVRQADIARRLANLAKARRRGAKTCAGHPWAMSRIAWKALGENFSLKTSARQDCYFAPPIRCFRDDGSSLDQMI